LGPLKSIGLDDIPAFVRKGCVDILIPLFTFILSLAYLSEVSLPSEKPDAIVPVFKKGNCFSK
jgi:hypothetical protein